MTSRSVLNASAALALFTLLAALCGCGPSTAAPGGPADATPLHKADDYFLATGYMIDYAFTGTVERIVWAKDYRGPAVVVWPYDVAAVAVVGQVATLQGRPPLQAGGRIAFVINSPVKTFGMSMPEAVGKRFQFTLYRKPGPRGQPDTLSLKAAPVKP